MRVNGALERAAFECLASNPAAAIPARVWFNTVDGKTYLDDGTLVRALLRNDGKALIGNSGTAAQNIRLHRGAASVLQLVAGSDVTAEGTLSTALAQFSARQENYTDGTKPAPGNAGRIAWVSDLNQFQGDTGSAWSPLGGGGSGGGINFVGLSATFALTSGTDFDLEASVGNHVAYADAAGVSPVDMTGGSPATTVVRSTSSPLNGAASLLMDLGTGSSRQGEGHSLVVNIPPGYRGLRLEYSFAFLTSGALVEDDLRLAVYDVTNAALITDVVHVNKVFGARGVARIQFPVGTNTTQIRVGLHIARTATTALSVKMDDFQVGPKLSTIGVAASDWVTYTPDSAGGWSTNVSYVGRWRRVGDSMQIAVSATLSGAPSGYLTPALPAGYLVDSAKLSSGSAFPDGQALGAWSAYNGSASYSGSVVFKNTNTVYLVGDTYTDAVSNVFPVSWGAGSTLHAIFTVPIVGWSSNVNIGSSTQFLISSYLATGTRVTGSAPTKLGEYRTRTRSAGSSTLNDNAPGTAPTASDGFVIYNNRVIGNAEVAANTEVYDIFIGKNKHFKTAYYASAGRTGIVDSRPQPFGTAADAPLSGFREAYDPVTGVLTIAANFNPSGPGTASNTAGISPTTFAGVGDSVYGDVVVSENALSVGSDLPRSSITVDTGNGHGSSGTAIRRFTNLISSQGTDITYADSATDGASFTVNTSGVYSVAYSDVRAAGGLDFGVSVNAPVLSDSITDIPAVNRKVLSTTAGAAIGGACSVSFLCNAGDVVRAHTNTQADSVGIRCAFSITKVSS